MGGSLMPAMNARQIVGAVVLTVMALCAATAVFTHQHTTDPTPASELFNDIGGQMVKGFTCSGMMGTVARPCSPIGGQCEGWLSKSCKCKPGFSGAACDWGPKTPSSNTLRPDEKEEIARIKLAYDFSNAVYYQTHEELAKNCPGFVPPKDSPYYGQKTGLVSVSNEESSTHAGATFLMPSESPSGKA